MATYYYDPNRVTIVIAGIPIDSGFAEDEMCTFEREGDDFQDVAGVDGSVSRSKNQDNRATFTLKLMQTSPLNAVLSALRLVDKLGDNGAGVGPFLLADKGGVTLITAEKCWIAKAPSVSMGKTAGPREWKIRIASAVEAVHGGN